MSAGGDRVLEHAEALVGRGRLQEARDVLLAVLRGNPGDVEARALLHAVNASLGDEVFEDGERAVRQLMAAGPASAYVAMQAAWLRFRAGEQEEAIAELRPLVVANQDDPRFHLAMGNLLVLTGRGKESWAEYEAALRLDGANVPFLHLVNAMQAARLAGATRAEVAGATASVGFGTRFRARMYVGPGRWLLFSLPALGVVAYLTGLVTRSLVATVVGGVLVAAFLVVAGAPGSGRAWRILGAVSFGVVAFWWFLDTETTTLRDRLARFGLLIVAPAAAFLLVSALVRRSRTRRM